MNLAHGLGGGSDLPIPASLAIGGGTAALTISFAVLLLAWREPRFADPRVGVPVGERLARFATGRGLAVALRVVGMVLFGFTVLAAVAGQDLLTNPTFGIVYVWLWVGIVPASLLFGPFFKAVSPARTLHLLIARLTGGDPERGILELPRRVGYWPAAVGLLAFVWLELVYPSSTYLGPVRLWFALYVAAMVLGAAVFGSRWLERADPFEVYSTLLGHLSVWGWTTDAAGNRRLSWRNPMRNLPTIPVEPGLVAVTAVLLGSTAFDSWRESGTWVRFVQSTTLDVPWLNFGLLLGICVAVGVIFTLACWATSAAVVPRRELPGRLAHSLVPIIVGYMVAHYLTYFVEVGQQTLIHASDPLGTGANLLGTGDWQINYWLSYHPTLLATVKVLAIVVGHVLGVIAAHDKALQLLPRRSQVTGQLALLAAMVVYTFTGLYLLFGA